MRLAGQDTRQDCTSDHRRAIGQDGYAMAMLIVAIGVMALLWSVALPTWSQLAKREREAELIFRGEQYARAIGLYQRRYANAAPPSLDVLIEQKFLRKEYKDPMVEDGEFELLYLTSQQPGSSEQDENQGQRGGRQGGQPAGRATFGPVGAGRGGIIGVVSRSPEASVREYNGRTQYNQWQFIYLATSTQAGQPTGRGAEGAGGRGEGTQQGLEEFDQLRGRGRRGDGRGGRGDGRGGFQPAPFGGNNPPGQPGRGQ